MKGTLRMEGVDNVLLSVSSELICKVTDEGCPVERYESDCFRAACFTKLSTAPERSSQTRHFLILASLLYTLTKDPKR